MQAWETMIWSLDLLEDAEDTGPAIEQLPVKQERWIYKMIYHFINNVILYISVCGREQLIEKAKMKHPELNR
jgi:hypothetical protein